MLKFYIVSTAISCALSLISLLAMNQRRKREKINIPKIKYGLFENIRMLLLLLVPILNIYMGLAFTLNYENIYQKAVLENQIKE